MNNARVWKGIFTTYANVLSKTQHRLREAEKKEDEEREDEEDKEKEDKTMKINTKNMKVSA